MTAIRWTIKRKLLALGAGTLLPVLLLTAFWAWWEAREHIETVEAELALASTQAASQVEQMLQELTSQLSALARDPAIERGETRRIEEFVDVIRRGHPELENVIAFGVDGRVISTAGPDSPGAPVTVADRAWFQHVRAKGQPAVSGYLIGRISGQPVAVVAVPLRRAQGLPSEVLAASVNLQRLHSLFQPLPLTGGRTVTVVDAEGRVLSHAPNAEGRIGQRFPSAPALPSERAVLSDLLWPEGERSIAAVAPVAGTGWRVLVGMPRASLQERVYREIRAITLPLLGLLAVSSVIGFLIARRVWRPLEALTEAAGRLTRGEPAAVRVTSTDEVGALGRAFNTMAAEITEGRASLERRVSELTAMSEAASLLTGTLQLTQVLERLSELARTRLGAGVVRIWLREGSSDEFRLWAHTGVTREPREYRMRLGPGEGLVGWIMAHREPLVLADLQADPRLTNRDWAEAEGLLSFFGVPIVVEDNPVGTLVCMTRTRRDFPSEEVALAQALAAQAAGAIRNARLYEEVRARAGELAERNRQLQLLHEAARTMTAEHDLDRLLHRLMETAREFTGAAYGALAVFEEGQVSQFFTAGMTPEDRERIGGLPQGRGLLGHVFRHGQTLRLDDLTTHPAAGGFPAGHPPMHTFLGTPIRLREEIVGALYLTEKPGGFTDDDEALVVTLSADAGVAIDNARLLADLQRALDHLKAAQEQLVQAEALRAVGELAAGTAHHINNILAVIRGRVQLLLKKVTEPEIRRPLEIVDRAAGEGAEVVRRMHEFARARPLLEPVPVDLNQLVDEILELTRSHWHDEAQQRGISIAIRWEPGQIPAASGDPASLREVLVNLLLNAVDALPEGGEITARTWATDERVHCSVADTGVGMTEAIRHRALEPFFTTKGPQCRGLGLSLSHGIIQRHGGTLSIESAEGRGTTVTFSVPVALARPVTPVVSAPAPAPAGPQRILVIDDEDEVRETLADILVSLDHLVTRAASGAEGVSLFRANHHDLVFTDLGMPGMTGWQVAAAVKALSLATPVVLVTGWGDDVTNSWADSGRVDRILRKPFDVEDIAAILAKIAAGRPGHDLGTGRP